MKENKQAYGDKIKVTSRTFLKVRQVLWGKTDPKEPTEHYKIIFNVDGEEEDKKISVIGITTSPKEEFLKINENYFRGETKIQGWLDVEYLRVFSYQELLALPELYVYKDIMTDKELIININNMLNKLYELKSELVKMEQKLRSSETKNSKTQQKLNSSLEDNDDLVTTLLVGGVVAGVAAIGSFFLGQHIEKNKKDT